MDVHEQAHRAELRARRIALLLEVQPRWPETPAEASASSIEIAIPGGPADRSSASKQPRRS